jgi:hypothetical protein
MIVNSPKTYISWQSSNYSPYTKRKMRTIIIKRLSLEYLFEGRTEDIEQFDDLRVACFHLKCKRRVA